MNINQRTLVAATALACLGALSMSSAAIASDGHPAGPACMDIKWNAEMLKMYPRAPAACQEVAVRDGKKYARFVGKVTSIGPEGVAVRFSNVAGDPGREITVKPGANSKVTMAGKKVAYSTLQKGDELTFWVPENQVGVISDPEDTESSTIVLK
jgi:hypothetical protein